MSIHKLSFALVLSSSVMLCGQLAAQSGTTQEVPATAAPQVAQPATAAPQVAQPAAAEQKPAEPAAPADLEGFELLMVARTKVATYLATK